MEIAYLERWKTRTVGVIATRSDLEVAKKVLAVVSASIPAS